MYGTHDAHSGEAVTVSPYPVDAVTWIEDYQPSAQREGVFGRLKGCVGRFKDCLGCFRTL